MISKVSPVDIFFIQTASSQLNEVTELVVSDLETVEGIDEKFTITCTEVDAKIP